MPHEEPPNTPSPGSPSGSPKSEYIPFTDKSIEHLKPTSRRRIVWARGLPGLGIRVTPKGTKSFVYKYDIDGQDRWLTFGQYPKVKLAVALTKYAEALAMVEAGEDPAEENTARNAAVRKAPTVKQLADDYIEKYAKPRKRSWEEDKRILDYDVIPQWGTKKAARVMKRDVIALLDEIVERGAPVQANRTLAVIRRMFNFAIDRDVLTASPCHRVKPPSSETRKERYLTLDEVNVFWNGLDTAPITRQMKDCLRLLLLTLQRCSEVASIQIAELNLKNETWMIPGEKTKNKRPHMVALSKPAVLIVKRLMREANDDGFLFPGEGSGPHLTNSSVSRAIARNIGHFGLPKFTPHDLRRTGSTQLAAFKVPRFDRDRVLNHTDRTIGAVYDIYGYEDEKRATLNLWADIIEHAIKSKKKVDADKLRKKLKYQDYLSD